MSWFWWAIGIYGVCSLVGWLIDEIYGPPAAWIGIALAEDERRKREANNGEASR